MIITELIQERYTQLKQNNDRCVGNTTRIVDDAIQRLFKYGKIIIKHPLTINDEGISLNDVKNIYVYEPTFVDKNILTSKMNSYLFKRILTRLQLEHTYYYNKRIKIIDKNTIQIIKE